MIRSLISVLMILVFNGCIAQEQQFSDIISSYNKEKQFNGSVIVATSGNIDFIQSIGLADRQHNIEFTNKSKFKIASMTKVFTAVLIMKLAEDNKISLNNTIGEYLTQYTGMGKDKITIHNLLTYSSGIENKLDSLGMRPYQIKMSLDKFIDTYCSNELNYEPGERSEYGNTEYILLHKIIEEVSNETYEDYLKEVILAPLSMKNTQMAKSYDITSDLCGAYLHDDSLNVFYNEDPYYSELYFGAGSLYSTVEDILKFDQGLFNDKLLNKESRNTMLTIHPEYGYTAYGLWGSTGWGNFDEPFYYRTGSILGSNTNWIHTMDTEKTIILLSNTNATNLYELSEKLYLESLKD